MRIFVSGSMAYDRIMDFPGRFSDHIMPDKIHSLNVSFMVNGLAERPGGTAGNIAYALSLLGERPTILATIGHDRHRYFEWLESSGISREAIRIIEDQPTASAYITTDLGDNQITAFNPGAMTQPSGYSLMECDPADTIAIIAPGNLEDMRVYSQACRTRGIPYIFDPGQSLPAWVPDGLRACIQGARLLIANDYEMSLITRMTGLERSDLLRMAEAIIVTRGGEGSTVHTAEGEVVIPVARARRVADPTGAGDAYRGGLIKGMVDGKGLREAALMGSVCASFAVEVQGTQEYRFTTEEFSERLRTIAPR